MESLQTTPTLYEAIPVVHYTIASLDIRIAFLLNKTTFLQVEIDYLLNKSINFLK